MVLDLAIAEKYQIYVLVVRLLDQQALAERDAWYDADDRTPAEQWLNDPPRWRSALAARRVVKSTTTAGVLTAIIETRGQ